MNTMPMIAPSSRRKLLALMAGTALAAASLHLQAASERGSPADAKALVTKAVAYLKANGKDKAFVKFQEKDGGFLDRDLYLSVTDMSGKTLAHGSNPRMVGKDNINFVDADGKPVVKERIALAKAKPTGQQDYRTLNPVTQEIEQKTAYFERVDDLIIACGYYKP